MNRRALDDRQSTSHKAILLLHPALGRQVLYHLAQNAKAMEQLLNPQEQKTITGK